MDNSSVRTVGLLRNSMDNSTLVTLGRDFQGRVLVVIYTYRSEDLRLISARKATPNERKHYEGRIRF